MTLTDVHRYDVRIAFCFSWCCFEATKQHGLVVRSVGGLSARFVWRVIAWVWCRVGVLLWAPKQHGLVRAVWAGCTRRLCVACDCLRDAVRSCCFGPLWPRSGA